MQRIVLLACAILFAAAASGDPLVDALFDPAVLHNVQISMKDSDWAQLRATYQENTNYDVTITFDGETVADSTIRSRGSGTRNGIKPGLRADFNRKVKSQTFRGFKTLVLDNMYNDASFIREQLAFAVFAQAGITVPREAFARLTVNGQYWGLYAIVEPIDKIFVTNHVDGGDGNLFEYNAPSPVNPDDVAWNFTLSRGASIGDYVPELFDPKTHEDDLDGTALLALIRTVTEAPDATFVHDIGESIDPHELLTYYAVEVATAEVDGLTSFFGVNNFYLYQREHSSRFLFIPWDHDFNFVGADHDIYYGLGRNRLMQRLLADAELRAFYRSTLQSIVTQFVNPEWMTPRIDAMVTLIHTSVLEDTKRRDADFDAAVATVRTVVAGRAASVAAQLQASRRHAVRH